MSAAAEGQRIALDAYSAYTKTPVYAVGGETVFGLRLDVVLPNATDSKYTVPSQFAGRLDLIANFANGDARAALSTLEMVVLNGEVAADAPAHVVTDLKAKLAAA